MTTKILALTDALGNLVRFVLLPGHRFDTVGVAPLIYGSPSADYRRQGLRQQCHHCQPQRARRKDRDLSAPTAGAASAAYTELYKCPHLIENFFCKLKEFKRISMRADKTDQSFAAIIHLLARCLLGRRAAVLKS